MVSREDGSPLPSAVIRVLGTDLHGESAASGSFSIAGVPPGRHDVGISLVGYRPALVSLDVTDTDSLLTRRFTLEPVAFALNEVVVRAAPPGRETHAQIISKDRLERLPATGDDIFRAVQVLPGIVAPDVNSAFLVRGGESDETLVRLDEIDLLEPHHIRDWGGGLSVVSLDAVSRARLQRGGLPARYGRHLSGALEIETPGERYETSAAHVALGVTQVRGLAFGPLGPSGSYLVGARHGLLGAVYRTLHPDPDIDLVPEFQDVLAEARLAPKQGHELRILALGARDDLLYDDRFNENDIASLQRNVTIGASYRSRPSARARHVGVLSADFFDRRRRLGQNGRDDDRTRALRSRVETLLAMRSSQSLELGVGGEWEDARIAFRGIDAWYDDGVYQEETTGSLAGRAVRRRLEAFASLHSRWGERISTTVGLNGSADDYGWGLRGFGFAAPREGGGFNLAPRISAAVRPYPALTLRLALGRLTQPVFLNHLSSERAVIALGRSREANEAVVGLDLGGAGAKLRIEAYARSDTGIGFPIQDLSGKPSLDAPLDRGHARGVEIQLESPSFRRVSAWIGYALSEATWSTSRGVVPRSFDQRHAITASVDATPAGRWTANVTGRYHSGTPYTREVWEEVTPRVWRRTIEPFMGARYPDYFRLDLRLSHPLRLGRSSGRFFLELINATRHANVYFYSWHFERDPSLPYGPNRTTIELFPRFPTFGVEIAL